jgi:predicted ribosomally synthesized peptide with SipW-like signal peptide
MTDDGLRLTRRKVLGSLGAVGVGSVGAGLSTTAFFSDEESFQNNSLVAGELDMMVAFQEHYSDWSTDENDDLTDDAVLRRSETVDDEDESDSDTDGDGVDDWEVLITEGDPSQVPDGYVGFPVPMEPLIAVPEECVDDFMANTAIDAYPDFTDDGIQETILTRNQYSNLHGHSGEELESAFRDQFANLSGDMDSDERTAAHSGDPLVQISDVKPGDLGEVTFGMHTFNNPGHVWMEAQLVEAGEHGHTEPEASDVDEHGPAGELTADVQTAQVELLDEIQVAIWHDDGDNVLSGPNYEPGGEVDNAPHDVDSDTTITLSQEAALVHRGTLRETLGAMEAGGLHLDADAESEEHDCFPNSTTRYCALAWWLPADHANEIQTDSVAFDVGFYTEQCRHNTGQRMPATTVELGADAATNTGFAASDGEGFIGSGYWTDDPDQTNQDSETDEKETYEQLYVTFDQSFGPYYVDELAPFTVGDIASIRYRTRRPAGAEQDYYLELYTMPDDPTDDDIEPGDDASWYGGLLQALPGDALDRDVTADEWVTWRTESGRNQLTWYDHNHDYDTTDSISGANPDAYLGVDTGVTLLDLQSTPQFDWSDYVPDADATQKNYRDEQVRAIRFATGSGWEDSHEGDLDAIEIRLTDGRSALVDLEP